MDRRADSRKPAIEGDDLKEPINGCSESRRPRSHSRPFSVRCCTAVRRDSPLGCVPVFHYNLPAERFSQLE